MRTAVALSFAALVAALTLSVAPERVAAGPISLPPADDAYVSSAAPDEAFGAERQLLAGDDSAGGSYRTYLAFEVPELEDKVTGVRLELYAPAAVGRDLAVAVTRSAWSEDTITWASAPDEGGEVTADRSRAGDGWVDIRLDVGQLAAGRHAFVLTSHSGEVVRFLSRESAHAPRLVIQFGGATADATATPEAPTPTSTAGEPPAATAEPAPTAQPTDAPASTPTAAPTSAPTAAPTAAPTLAPRSDVPPIPAGYGELLRKDFGDGRLAPFRILTYPNDHPGDLMIQYGSFVTGPGNVSVHDGYLDLRATRNALGLWDQAFVGTGMTGDGTPATFQFQYGTARAMARMNTGRGAWQSLWYLVADRWGAEEIDWAELIGGRLTANVHGSNADGQAASLPAFPPDEWHEYGITKAPTYIAFLLDGREVGRANVAMPAPMALLADAKVGLAVPDGTTPSTLFLQVAWWTVDPLS